VDEFARGEGAHRTPLAEAAINAAHGRFRPTMLNSRAFILGTAPIAGAGAAGQQVLGTAVLDSMVSAAHFNYLFVLPFYLMLQGMSEWLKTRAGEAWPDRVQLSGGGAAGSPGPG
jgi:multidrug efflux pump subunit AcrB